MLALLVPLVVVSSSVPSCSAEGDERARHRRFPDLYTYEIVAEYPHDPNAFTQG